MYQNFRCMKRGGYSGVYQLVKARTRRTKKLKVKKERENLINFKKEFLMCHWWGCTYSEGCTCI